MFNKQSFDYLEKNKVLINALHEGEYVAVSSRGVLFNNKNFKEFWREVKMYLDRGELVIHHCPTTSTINLGGSTYIK